MSLARNTLEQAKENQHIPIATKRNIVSTEYCSSPSRSALACLKLNSMPYCLNVSSPETAFSTSFAHLLLSFGLPASSKMILPKGLHKYHKLFLFPLFSFFQQLFFQFIKLIIELSVKFLISYPVIISITAFCN